jgi:hypothetical protein
MITARLGMVNIIPDVGKIVALMENGYGAPYIERTGGEGHKL